MTADKFTLIALEIRHYLLDISHLLCLDWAFVDREASKRQCTVWYLTENKRAVMSTALSLLLTRRGRRVLLLIAFCLLNKVQ